MSICSDVDMCKVMLGMLFVSRCYEDSNVWCGKRMCEHVLNMIMSWEFRETVDNVLTVMLLVIKL
jgi:hypothetical protein